MPRVFVTHQIPDEGLELLRNAGVEVVVNERETLSREELVREIREADGILCLLTDRIDAALLDEATRCVGVANYAVGFENIDVAHATRRGIVVTNTPGVLTEATADLTWGLLLAVARRLVEGDRMVREGRFTGWGPLLLLGHEVFGTTLGIVGAGRIGTAVARRAMGFGMSLLYSDTCGKPQMDDLGARCVALGDLLAQSDFVSLHVPLTPATHHLIGGAELARMKRTAILINTSRGAVVDERALVQALREGVIAGAGLDVFEHEPALTPGLAELPNVVLAPHIGSATVSTRRTMATLAARGLVDLFEDRTPANVVNPEVLAHRRRLCTG